MSGHLARRPVTLSVWIMLLIVSLPSIRFAGDLGANVSNVSRPRIPSAVHTVWAMFHFSPDRRGENPYETILSPDNVANLGVKWSTLTSYSSAGPTVSGGVVYLGDLDGNLWAVRADDGSVMWSRHLGSLGVTQPAVANGIVYAGVIDGRIVALSARTGATRWSKALAGLVGGIPAVLGGVVYIGAGSYLGTLYALDASSGSTLWESPDGGGSSAPAIAGGAVYIGGTDWSVRAYDQSSGEPLWTRRFGNQITATPALADGLVFIGTSGSEPYRILALDASTGKTLWRHLVTGKIVASPAVAAGLVYFATLDGCVHALTADTGELAWSKSLGGDVASSPALANGVLYIGSNNNHVYALDATKGEELWTYTTGGLVGSSPVVLDGTVYVGSFDQMLYAFSLPGSR